MGAPDALKEGLKNLTNETENEVTVETNGNGLELAGSHSKPTLNTGAPTTIKGKYPLNKSLQRIGVNNRGRVLLALFLYSIFYGALIVNLVDLRLPLGGWFHVFLIVLYFCPSFAVLIVLGFRSWGLALALGLLVSLMNDLFYAPMANILSVSSYDLARWYARQLGLLGFEEAWVFQAGLLSFRTTSIIIGLSVYIRIIAILILIIEWWKKWH